MWAGHLPGRAHHYFCWFCWLSQWSQFLDHSRVYVQFNGVMSSFVYKIDDLTMMYWTICYTFGPQNHLHLSFYVTIFCKQSVHDETVNLKMARPRKWLPTPVPFTLSKRPLVSVCMYL